MFDYNKIQSLPDDEFEKIKPNIEDMKNDPRYSKTDLDTLKKVERFLDLKEGALKDVEAYLQRQTCPCCNKEITLLDRVITGLVDAEHPKSFIVHTMLGNKTTLNQASFVRCSGCGTKIAKLEWHFWGFIYCNF